MTFVVKSVLNDDLCMTPTDGEKLFNAIRGTLNSDGAVVMDFTGIRIVIAAFFDGFFAKYAKEFGRYDIRDRLTVTNISEIGEKVFEAMIDTVEKHIPFAILRKNIGDYLGMADENQNPESDEQASKNGKISGKCRPKE